MILYVVEFPEGFPEGDFSSPKKGPNPGFGAVTRGLSPMDGPYSFVIPQIPLEMHTAGHMAIQEMTCKLVVYATTLALFTK